MKNYLKIGIVIVIIILLVVLFRRPGRFSFLSQAPQITPTPELNLPQGWTQVNSKDVMLKLEKKVDSGLKPQIVLTKYETKDAADPSKYLNRLIAGAKSAIPSLVILDKKETNVQGNFSAVMSGYYYNQKTKVNLIQRVLVKNNIVYTVTSSFSGNLDEEVNQIYDNVVSSKISL